jgi:hypothetical protein
MHEHTPIDIVYLWVDGNDPAWRRKRRAAADRLGAGERAAIGQHGNVEGRFRDNDELRYSLRALDRFFPEHGHVYLVTDDQTPHWLRPSDRLTIIDHRSLMPAASLPTFDSSHIESYIHRIPNLSERFFYLNDDVFFGAPVRLDDWFWEGGIHAAWSDAPEVSDGPLCREADSLDNASRLSKQWLSRPPAHMRAAGSTATATATSTATATGTGTGTGTAATPRALTVPPRVEPYEHTHSTFAHSPRPMLRSVLFHLEQLAPEMFDGVRSTVFRAWDKPTIVADFVIRWALAHGMARIRAHTHLHVSTGDDDLPYQLELLATLVGSVDFFCINDTTDDARAHDPRLARVRDSLEQLFPEASSFERPAALETSLASGGP